jgi:hypothetical protein
LRHGPGPNDYFPAVVDRNLRLYRVDPLNLPVKELAMWIYDDQRRCPGMRLGHDVFDQVRRNTTYKPRESDLGDLALVDCLPYVDAATLDASMTSFVRRAVRRYSHAPSTILESDVRELFRRLL